MQHAHDDHHRGARRRFLRQLGLLSAGTALVPGGALSALGSTGLAEALLDGPTDRVLVLIRLKGGNDGLNTVVPVYDYGRYAAARPTLGYAQRDLLALTPELAVGRDLAAAHGLWQRGAMRVVNGVGYAAQSLSHFRGTDIVASGSDAGEVLTSGWLGRHLDGCFPDYLAALPAAPPAIQIGGAGSLTFDNDERVSLGVSVASVEDLAQLAERGELYDTAALPDCAYGAQLGYLRAVANAAFGFAGVIREAYERSRNQVAYPAGQLAAQLALVARLVKGGLGTGLYLVTLDGFDTHAGQGADHPALLRQLGQSVAAFFDDLAAADQDGRVLASTFSEFGRRIEENGSRGTDHGTAAPQLLFGPALGGNGAVGGLPDLDDPDGAGNLRHTTDYRSVYATLLERWLCVDPARVDEVLGGAYPRLDLGIGCATVGAVTPPPPRPGRLAVELVSAGPGQWAVRLGEPRGARYSVEVLDASGRVLSARSIALPAGAHEVPLPLAGSPSGVYAYRVRDGRGRVGAGLVPALR